MSSTRLRRWPDVRKARMGGMTARPFAVAAVAVEVEEAAVAAVAPALMGVRKDTGGAVDVRWREKRRWSSEGDVCSVLGRSSSRWPCAHSLVEASTAAWAAAWCAACAACASTAWSRCVLSATGGNDVATPFARRPPAAAVVVAFRPGAVAAGVVVVESWIRAAAEGDSGNDAGRRDVVALFAEVDGGEVLLDVWNVDARVRMGFGAGCD